MVFGVACGPCLDFLSLKKNHRSSEDITMARKTPPLKQSTTSKPTQKPVKTK